MKTRRIQKHKKIIEDWCWKTSTKRKILKKQIKILEEVENGVYETVKPRLVEEEKQNKILEKEKFIKWRWVKQKTKYVF